MKYLALICALLVLAVRSATADDKLISYDKATSIITVDRGGQLKTYRVKPFTELTINGLKVPIERLTPGMMVNITLSDAQTASRIAARGAMPAQFNGRTIHLKMNVDGSDIVHVRGGALTIEHKSNRKPNKITVNGVEWEPKWNGDMTEPFTNFTPPLVPFGTSAVRFKQVAGRTKAEPQKMAGGGFEKIFTFSVTDGPGGDDDFEFLISW